MNRINWHPSEMTTFISGSQDGTMKMFDYRVRQGCVATYLGKSQAVRDVQFNPISGHLLAAAFDSGIVQIWDTRKGSIEKSINAHQGLVLGIDWHPSGTTLASCSRDRAIKIWDVSTGKAKHTIQTIASVGRVAWRGSGWNDQLASTAALLDFKLHLWNVQRPFIPVASCAGHRDVATGFVWINDSESIITCGKDGKLILHHLSAAEKPFESIRTSAIAFGSGGQLAFAMDPIDRNTCANMRSQAPNPSCLVHIADPQPIVFPKCESLIEGCNPEQVIHRVFDKNGAIHDVSLVSIALTSVSKSRSVEIDTFENIFYFLANSYQLVGESLHELCEQNAKVFFLMYFLFKLGCWNS